MTVNVWGPGALLVLGLALSAPAVSASGQDAGLVVSGDAGRGFLDGSGDSARPLDYDSAESAGEVQDLDDIKADATITGFRDGEIYAALGDVALLSVPRGRSLKAGEECVAFHDEGEIGAAVPGAGRTGRLLDNVAVLRVLRCSGRDAAAEVVKLYGTLQTGDQLRSRAARRRAYEALLDMTPAPGKPLKGVVVGVIPPDIAASTGDFVYLNVGYRQGAVPGVRLKVLSSPDQEAKDYGGDDDSSAQPAAPIRPLEASDELSRVMPSGDIAALEVVNASADACAARVVHCEGVVDLGDRVARP